MIDYKQFIEDSFLIKNKQGVIVPFIFNDTQNHYYDILLKDYPDFQGIRENDLKFRQPGFSSFIDGIFTTDFIFGALEKGPITTGQVISHKESETKILFKRVNLFLDSFCQRNRIDRRKILKTDTGTYLESYSLSELFIGTAGAKTLGRGGTLQNLHWSEVAFYPNTEILNAEDLVLAAEQQVPPQVGKIFRESTGNLAGDFFETEYDRGTKGLGEFKSRFFGWWIHAAYKRDVPENWKPPQEYIPLMKKHNINLEQVYWHFKKMQTAKDKKKIRREYPSDETEAFLMGGDQYFDPEAIIHYLGMEGKPIKEGVVYI